MNTYHIAILRAIEEIRGSEQDFETAHRGVVKALATLGIAVTPADEAGANLIGDTPELADDGAH